MPLENKTISLQQILAAYNRLQPEERLAIDHHCDRLIRAIKDRREGKVTVPFSKSCALELLAKIGILIITETRK